MTPAGMPLAVRALGDGVPEPSVRAEGGRSIREYRAMGMEPDKQKEQGLPRDVPPGPVVYFSTAPSWDRLASAYAAIVDRTIAAKPVPLPKEAVVPGDPAGTALNLVRWINDRVRYIGLELGENSIVPYPPGEILSRGHGDCKDKASLLVSLLRQAGYDASVALLWNGSDLDFPPDLPGMDHFNHAIVRVEGSPGLWIDPTVEWGRDTALPPWDQERWALVARRAGGGLVRTVAYDQSANDNTVVLEYFLKGKGRCDLTETTTWSGGYDLYNRQRRVYADPAKTKTDLESYVKDHYGEAKLDSWTYSDPKDFSRPFSLALKIKDSYRAYTGLDDAQLYIQLGELMSWLPGPLRARDAPARVAPYRQSYPFVVHFVHRIHLPAGFVLRAAPDPVDRMLGTVRLRSSSSTGQDGTVVVRYDLETTRVTLSQKEFDQTRAAVTAYLDKLETVTVAFDHRAGLLFANGSYREAFDLHRELVGAAPGEAIHEIRLSRALLAAGLGDEAAAAARHAAGLAPADTEALDNLAWILQHDALGRRFGKGWDRDGAIAGYQKLFARDATMDYSRADCAIMLEYDARGVRYGDPAGLEDALAQYRQIKKPLKDLRLEENPVRVLMHLGRFGEMETAAAGLSDPKQREVYLLVARSALRGTTAAVAGMNKQASRDDQRQYLAQAGSALSTIHRYPEAAELLRQAARGSSSAANLEYQADLLAGLRPSKPADLDAGDPVDLVKVWFGAMTLRDGREFQKSSLLLGPDLLRMQQQKKNPSSRSVEEVWVSLFTGTGQKGVDREFFLDVLFSSCTFAVTGDAKAGWHIVITSPMAPDTAALSYVVEQRGGRLLITATNSLPASYLIRVRELLRSGDVQTAARYLDWLRNDLAFREGDTAAVMKEAWSANAQPTAGSVGRALVLLSAAFPESAADVRAVDAYPAGDSDSARTAALLARRVGSLSLRDYQLVLESAAKLYEFKKDDTEYRDHYLNALLVVATLDRFDAELAALRKSDPQDRELKRLLLQSLIRRRDTIGIERFIREENWQPTAGECNNIAWNSLFEPAVSDQALEYARKAVNLTKAGDRNVLHTLAALYAETGRYEDARGLMDKCLELTMDGEPEDEDWYVFGRIAEGYGFPVSARSAYLKVLPPELPDPTSTWLLAQKRLAGLPK
jgi:Flp pilus assembly protein TadD